MHRRLLLIVLLYNFPLPVAEAHDPGLSRTQVRLSDAGTAVHMVLARQDLEVLARLDANRDGAVSEAEFSAAGPGLESLLMAAVAIDDETGPVSPTSVRTELTQSDAVNVDFYFDGINASTVRIQIPLLAQLARGHRQYLTVRDSNGKLLSQHILDARSPPVLLQAVGPDRFAVFGRYLKEGVRHIWIGFDHVLFLLTLLLPAVLVYRKSHWQAQDKLRPAMIETFQIVTAFTLAHSVTLAISVLGVVSLPPRLVESAIALSVLVTGVNNLRPFIPSPRWLIAFVFGLVHGFGFAGVLVDLGLPAGALTVSLLGFNLGVEVGQIAIVALVLPLAGLIRHTSLYRTWVFGGGSAAAVVVAAVWMFERISGRAVYAF